MRITTHDVQSFEIDLLRDVTTSVQCLGLLEQKGAIPRDVHGEQSYSCQELRTKGCSESDTFHTLHNIGKIPPTVRSNVLKRSNCTRRASGGALWKPRSEAYVCKNSHYEGFQGASRTKPNERTTDVIQAATATTSLSAGSEKCSVAF